jgi:hypothetical protein
VTADSPKGPEREARPELSGRIRKALDDAYEGIDPENFLRSAPATDAVMAIVGPEVERLTAEVEQQNRWYRQMGSERDEKQMEIERLRRRIGAIRGALIEAVWESLPPSVSTLRAVQWLVSEYERMREQLATAVVLPQDAGEQIANALGQYVEMENGGDEPEVQAVLALLRSWVAPVSESVPVTPEQVGAGLWHLEADVADAIASVDAAGGTYKDQAKAALRVARASEVQANSKLEQNLDEGRPSGSGAATPRSGGDDVRALLIHPAAWSGLVQWLDSRGIYVQTAGDLEGIPCWSMGVHDLDPPVAAQAARSEASPNPQITNEINTTSSSPPSGGDSDTTPRKFQVGDEVRWCWSGANADGTWFKARLTEEHPDKYPKGWAGEITDCGSAYTAEHMGEVPPGFLVYMDIPSISLVSSLPQEGGTDDDR